MGDWSKQVYPYRNSKKPVKTYSFENHEAFRRQYEERAESAWQRAEELESYRTHIGIDKITDQDLIERLKDELSAKNEEAGVLLALHNDSQQYIPSLRNAMEELTVKNDQMEKYLQKARSTARKFYERLANKQYSKNEEMREKLGRQYVSIEEKQRKIEKLLLEKHVKSENMLFLENNDQVLEESAFRDENPDDFGENLSKLKSKWSK